MSTLIALTVVPPFVAEALGSSVIYEEYKGDFAKACSLAEAQILQAGLASDAILLADARLARGIVHLLQGETSAALACFQEIDKSVPSDFDRRLRAASYARLATIWQYNLFPDGNGASAVELEVRWDGANYDETETSRQQAIFAQARTTLSQFESFLVHDLLCELHSDRAIIQSVRNFASDQRIQQSLQTAVQGPLQFRQQCETYNVVPALLAFADLTTADLYRRAGNMPLAMQFLERALQLAQQNGDEAAQGSCYLKQGDWLVAPFSTPLVWNFSIQESNSDDNSLPLLTETQEFSQQGTDLNQADTVYAEAEKRFQVAGARRGIAQVLLRRCYLATLTDDFTTATAFAQQAQAACETCGDQMAYWLAQAQRLLCRIGAGEYPEESSTAEKIGAWGATQGSFSYALGLGLFFCRAGRHWLLRRGDYERALACYRLATVTFKALGATINLAQSLAYQGAVYRALGESKTAITFYEQALDQYMDGTSARPSLIAMLSSTIVMLVSDLFYIFLGAMDADGMERTATRLHMLMEQLKQAGDLPIGIAQMFVTGGSALLKGHFDQALANLLQKYGMGKMMRSIIADAKVQAPLYRAKAAHDAGDLLRAEQLFAEAIRAAKTLDSAKRNFNMAMIFGAQKADEQAKRAFKRYLAQGGANAGFAGQMVSILQSVGGKSSQHEIALQQVRTHQQAITMFVHIKAFEEAKAHLDALVQLAGTDWWASSLHPWQDLSDCAELYEGLNDLDQALIFYDQAIAVLETRRSRLSREELKTALAGGNSVQSLYFQAARTALKQAEQTPDDATGEWANRALAYIERGKARALLDLMASSVIVAGSSRTETEPMRAWRSVSAQLALWRGLLAKERSRSDTDAQRIAQLNQQIEHVEVEIHMKENALAKADPTFYRTLNVQGEVLTLAQMRDALPVQTALLEYAALGDDLLIWAVTDHGVIVKQRLPIDAKALDREMRAYHCACMNPTAAVEEVDALGVMLAEKLLSPVAEAVCTCPNLIIVPYGVAHTLPFHALPWAGEPLVASHRVSYLPSASALQFVHIGAWPTLPERLLAVGNPQAMAYRPPLSSVCVSLPALSGAEDEAAYVASLFAEGQTLTGDDATESNVSELLGRYPLLHFATHGLLSEEAPLLSAILLADGEALSLYELMGLHLDADLVVLSACRTALGEITRGDEVIGLTRGLLGAGARAALVSLWPVNDISTSLLMGEFYRQLRVNRSPALAIQAAQNYLRQLTAAQIKVEVGKLKDTGYARDATRTGVTKPALDYQHPHFWAPFVLMG